MVHYCVQIGDFGLARDLGEGDLYQCRGGKIPIKWTAPEVSPFPRNVKNLFHRLWSVYLSVSRPCSTGSTPVPVTCGAMEWFSLRSGPWVTGHMMCTQRREMLVNAPPELHLI